MKFIIYIAAIFVVLTAASNLMRSEAMTENEKYLSEAREKIRAFETEREAERLREAAMALDNIVLAKEHEAEIRHRLRSDSLNLWLDLVRIIDRHLDPEFKADDVPQKLVQPPPTSDGTVYAPGADPALIDDPQARAEYEKARADNQAKTIKYRMQTQLRRLNERIPPRAEEFIRNSFTSSADDQSELKTAIDAKIENEPRKTALLKLLASSRP